jgi:hypothetical protein
VIEETEEFQVQEALLVLGDRATDLVGAEFIRPLARDVPPKEGKEGGREGGREKI